MTNKEIDNKAMEIMKSLEGLKSRDVKHIILSMNRLFIYFILAGSCKYALTNEEEFIQFKKEQMNEFMNLVVREIMKETDDD